MAAMARRPLSVFLLATVSCSLFGPDDRDELRENRDKWETLGIEDYTYTLRQDCFCGFPIQGNVRVRVRAGEVVAVNSIPAGDSVVGAEARRFWFPVDSLFAIADRALGRVASFDINYDGDYHFPSHLEIDWRGDTIDDEVTYTANSLTED